MTKTEILFYHLNKTVPKNKKAYDSEVEALVNDNHSKN